MSTVRPFLAHAVSTERQFVAADLRVLIAPGAGGGFVAQGIEIDYVATGATEEEARERFADGFIATIRSYLRRNRPLSGLFKSAAPAEAREAYFDQETKPMFWCEITEDFGPATQGAPIPRSISFVRHPNALRAA